MPLGNKKLCFVLMPFNDKLREVYDKAIKPACVKAGFESRRVDELKGTFNINRKIIEHIFSSDAIVADLTGWNPNVFYEMGVAHAIDNKTIMIIQEKENLPFDVSAYRSVLYDHTEAGLEKLSENITESLMSIEEWCKPPTNPVQEFKPYEALFPKASWKEYKRSYSKRKSYLQIL
jgi:nucleoside 2-deoxyribosyltransferase